MGRIFEPTDTLGRVLYALGSISWPFCAMKMFQIGEDVTATVLTVWSVIAWFYTIEWAGFLIQDLRERLK